MTKLPTCKFCFSRLTSGDQIFSFTARSSNSLQFRPGFHEPNLIRIKVDPDYFDPLN